MANVSDILLQAAMDHEVSEKLNGLVHRLDGHIKVLPEEKRKEAREKVLVMLQASCGAFFTKMQMRLESKGD